MQEPPSTASAIRPMRLEDAAAVAALAGELGYPAEPGEIAERIPALAADPTQCVRVAVDADGAVCGWIHAARQLVLEYGWRCEVLGLVVSAAARGAGHGQALLAEAERWAEEQGLAVVSLRSNTRRTEAHAFYDHLGYERVKTQLAFRKRLGP